MNASQLSFQLVSALNATAAATDDVTISRVSSLRLELGSSAVDEAAMVAAAQQAFCAGYQGVCVATVRLLSANGTAPAPSRRTLQASSGMRAEVIVEQSPSTEESSDVGASLDPSLLLAALSQGPAALPNATLLAAPLVQLSASVSISAQVSRPRAYSIPPPVRRWRHL